jgi:hypothetical protein
VGAVKGKPLTISAREPLKDGEFLTGYNSVFRVGDEELTGIVKADIHFRPGEIVTANLEFYLTDDSLSGIEIAPETQPETQLETQPEPTAKQVLMDIQYDIDEMVFNVAYRKQWERSVNRAYFALRAGGS